MTAPFGMLTTVRSFVRSRVAHSVMSSISPSWPPIRHVSPTESGRSDRIANPAEDVLEALLGGKREHEAADPEPRHRGRHVDAEHRQRQEDDQQDRGRSQRAAHQRERGRRGGAAGRHHAAQQMPVEPVHDPQEEPEQGEEEDDVRKRL